MVIIVSMLNFNIWNINFIHGCNMNGVSNDIGIVIIAELLQ